MEIGDLVRLSKSGEQVSYYVDIKDMARYGMMVGKCGSSGCWIRWFKHDGTLLLKTAMHERDLKKFE